MTVADPAQLLPPIVSFHHRMAKSMGFALTNPKAQEYDKTVLWVHEAYFRQTCSCWGAIIHSLGSHKTLTGSDGISTASVGSACGLWEILPGGKTMGHLHQVHSASVSEQRQGPLQVHEMAEMSCENAAARKSTLANSASSRAPAQLAAALDPALMALPE